jgi:hypothetical protein
MSLRDEAELRNLPNSAALEALGVHDEGARWRAVEAARQVWETKDEAENAPG